MRTPDIGAPPVWRTPSREGESALGPDIGPPVRRNRRSASAGPNASRSTRPGPAAALPTWPMSLGHPQERSGLGSSKLIEMKAGATMDRRAPNARNRAAAPLRRRNASCPNAAASVPARRPGPPSAPSLRGPDGPSGASTIRADATRRWDRRRRSTTGNEPCPTLEEPIPWPSTKPGNSIRAHWACCSRTRRARAPERSRSGATPECGRSAAPPHACRPTCAEASRSASGGPRSPSNLACRGYRRDSRTAPRHPSSRRCISARDRGSVAG